MAFVASFEDAARKIRTTIYVLAPISVRPHRVRTRYIEARVNSSKMRLQVLRRDRYKCRSCNRAGDEVTLEMRQIRPSASTIEEMLTLCVHCGNLVDQWNLTAGSDLEFLEQLRHRACSTPETQFRTTVEALNRAACSPSSCSGPPLRS
jgi:DNA-directed RNA polymerase subunit M/transcription elongation factor TFIIS